MSARRTLVLAALVALGVAGVLLVPAPETPRPRDQVEGAPVVPIRAAAVVTVEIALADGRAHLVRGEDGWVVDGVPAGERLAAAARDLVETLTTLRVVDRFRDDRDGPFGLDAPVGHVAVEGAGRTVRLVLGGFNAAGSAVYARRDARPHVLLVGAYLLSAMDRVFYYRHLERRAADGPEAAQRPEMG